MTTFSVAYLIGSLATGSINRKLARALTRLAPPSLALTEITFKDLPLYSYDHDADFPPVARGGRVCGRLPFETFALKMTRSHPEIALR